PLRKREERRGDLPRQHNHWLDKRIFQNPITTG
ncbi:MAG: hypothetical protein ACI80L_001667, partial [Pseudohongiellaceae bacterium]